MSNLIVLLVISFFTLCIDIAMNVLLNLISESDYEKEIKQKIERNKIH